MSNESYHIFLASLLASSYKLGTGVIILLKFSSKGKTHTVKMLERDFPSQVKRLIPGTATVMYDVLMESSPNAYYIDDRDKWAKEFTTGIRYIKLLSDSEKVPIKMTRYNRETVLTPTPSYAWCWLLLNPKQYDLSFDLLSTTGIASRSIVMRIKHSNSNQEYIEKCYDRNGWNDHNLPFLKYHNDWLISSRGEIRTLTDKDILFIEKFPDSKQRYVKQIARVMTEQGFKAVQKTLLISETGAYFEEEIEFDKKEMLEEVNK